MNTAHLVKITKNKKKRLGQGHGSGRVKTSGRGTKGQKARGKVPATRYSGGSIAFVKRLPFLRGKSKNKPFKKVPAIVSVEALSVFSKGDTVDVKSLIKANLVSAKDAKVGVKILGSGTLEVALTIALPVTKGAKKAIEKAGGKVDLGNE